MSEPSRDVRASEPAGGRSTSDLYWPTIIAWAGYIVLQGCWAAIEQKHSGRRAVIYFVGFVVGGVLAASVVGGVVSLVCYFIFGRSRRAATVAFLVMLLLASSFQISTRLVRMIRNEADRSTLDEDPFAPHDKPGAPEPGQS